MFDAIADFPTPGTLPVPVGLDKLSSRQTKRVAFYAWMGGLKCRGQPAVTQLDTGSARRGTTRIMTVGPDGHGVAGPVVNSFVAKSLKSCDR